MESIKHFFFFFLIGSSKSSNFDRKMLCLLTVYNIYIYIHHKLCTRNENGVITQYGQIFFF